MAKALLLHGMFGSPALLEPLGNALKRYGWDPVIPDLYENRADSARFDDYIDRAADAFGRMNGDEKIVVGHSMGGLIGQKLAAECGVDGLVLVCSAPPAPIPLFNWKLACTMFANWQDNLWPIIAGDELSVRREDADELLFNRIPAKERERLYGMLRPELGRVARELLFGVRAGEVDCGVLCVTAGDDNLIPPSIGRRIAEHYHAGEEMFESAGHMLPVERPHEVALAINRWWRRTNHY